SDAVLCALAQNPRASEAAQRRIAELLPQAAPDPGLPQDPWAAAADERSEFVMRFAAEIAAAEGTPFSLVDPAEEERAELARKQHDEAVPGLRLSVLQKIAHLSVGERVQLAMRGSRDERFILIRDGSR